MSVSGAGAAEEFLNHLETALAEQFAEHVGIREQSGQPTVAAENRPKLEKRPLARNRFGLWPLPFSPGPAAKPVADLPTIDASDGPDRTI